MGREHRVKTNFKTLGVFINGKAFKSNEWSKTGIPIIRIQNLNNEISNYNFCDFEAPTKYYVKNGDLLFAWSGTPGTSFGAHMWQGGRAVLNQHIFRIEELAEIINKKFFMYLINSNLNEYIAAAHGTAGLAHITKAKFEESETSIPPLNEQKHIVEKLDTILPKVKSAKARLEKFPGILKKFRQSVLSAACSGRLTEDWRGKNDLSAAWQECFLPEALESKPKNGYSGKPVKYGTKIRVLSLSATTAGVFNPKFYKYLDEVIPEDSSAWLKRNDIIIQRGNTLEYVGIPAIYKGENNQFIYPDLMIRLSARKNILLPDFLYFFLSWEKIRNYMRDNASGTAGTMPKINQGVLKNLILSLPSLPEQHEIVRRVEKLFSLADSLEAKYKKVMGRVEKIEQAVLAKAFRGKLVEPDPNDEPAEELLKRILEEKAKIKPKNRKSSGKKK